MSENGILIINKPLGWTSHDVVAKTRNIFGIKKVGHAGTLDPAASGVLVVMVGKKATQLSDKLRGKDKEYLISIEFGKSTLTGDVEGEILNKLKPTDPKLQITSWRLKRTLEKFKGEIKQRVPWFSAVKVGGRKLYQVARKEQRKTGRFKNLETGQRKPVERPVKKIQIYEIELLSFTKGDAKNYPAAKIKVVCGSGTYTRSLVEDIGKELGVPAYQTDLLRTRVGEYKLSQAITINKLITSPDPFNLLLSRF